MLRYLHIIRWIWLCCIGPVIAWRVTKVYIVSVVICTSKELVNGRQIDKDQNFISLNHRAIYWYWLSIRPSTGCLSGHLLTVCQAIYGLSIRPSTDCLSDPSVQDQSTTENQSHNFKISVFSLCRLKWLSWIPIS